MYRFLSVAAGAATIASAAPFKGANNYNGDKYDNDGKYGYSPNQVSFAPAYQIIDPSYASTILARYQECVTKKCSTLPSGYSSTSVEDNLSSIASYTSCVTSCAGAEALQTTQDFQKLLGEVLEIGASQLKTVRKHLSGQDASFDAIQQRIHIGESCCLPNDYFAEWSRIMVPVKVADFKPYNPPRPPRRKRPTGSNGGKNPNVVVEQIDDGFDGNDDDDLIGDDDDDDDDDSDDEDWLPQDEDDDDDEEWLPSRPIDVSKRELVDDEPILSAPRPPRGRTTPVNFMISAPEYVAHCTNRRTSLSKNALYDAIECDDRLNQYLIFLQANVGHLILSPDCDDRTPDGACCKSASANPRATPFPTDVCVAYESSHGGKVATLSVPFVKPIQFLNGRLTCPSDVLEKVPIGTGDSKPDYIVKYQRVKQRDLKYFTVMSGLPSQVETKDFVTTCKYEQGFVGTKIDNGFFTTSGKSPSVGDIDAAKKCPTDGLFEYCSLDQYASFLQTQLFDHSGCDISELRSQHTDSSSAYQTVACLYKIFTLKCDCMEAVLNCYTHASKFDNALSKTIGHAASILCGFILCQQPSVYSLFGEQFAIDHAILIKEFLQSAGLMSSQVTPALTMLVSFGLGMMALVAAKKVKGHGPVKIENGYQNLI
ncbi:hypothetical protein H310_06783 [Aphanomyces invadans]|uniref:Uncharacterized protein n=1 Tax=Aphanomyces invadans TaxID=157072 RepID=A0A024U436_9STRA|nr:hypothetical protein H310_06783 [Aphanomyces invadans]ETW01186.1 hypothetical protein H310_06783 [Aphanomyces invadans]|eukprot:XP_008870184.1 hypothetical protein H310_06783 [Aphanomyces invadans]